MHPLLTELHAYHHAISATIVQINNLLDKCKSATGDAADRQELFKLLASLHGAAEARHHQNEELIRRQLLNTRAPVHHRVLEIERDHQGFARIAGQLKALEGSSHTPIEIAPFVEDYLHKYHDHMDSEEHIFFPMADEWLTDRHWQEIKQQWQKEAP
ncbi:hemerythrin domain-containing protein [Pseudomonas sp. sp1636]|uniref:hemerythrin domain-containing protein n=1 Tax=Pseudomonas sp. sp1636 TaxID=3036707 RepID=UPI0025A517F9|nr:hemerythrin domain-containing protein [Pseudomonas sp. sp1636]MDM8350388.1 hemerythrin domain-containing protein [Pseudomonas sp. sp1636]